MISSKNDIIIAEKWRIYCVFVDIRQHYLYNILNKAVGG